MTRVLIPLLLATTILLAASAGLAKEPPTDPHLWLEEVHGEKALAWVEKQNAAVRTELEKHPAFDAVERHTLALLEADDRIPGGRWRGDWMYGFWRDARNPRGLYRRASVASYLAGKPTWEVVLDLDALAKKEGRSWVWRGMELRHPDYERGLLRLSDGGTDAVVIREFDLPTRRFVERGFWLEKAKGGMSWIDADSVFVATDFGEGSLTTSGYPRIVKRWKRGTPLAEAEVVLEGAPTSISVGAERQHYGRMHLDMLRHGTSFYTAKRWLLEEGGRIPIEIPDTARIHTVIDGQVLIEAKYPWALDGETYAPGTVLAVPLAELRKGKTPATVVFEPTPTASVTYITRTKSYVLAVVMEDVRDRLYRYDRAEDGSWSRREIPFEGHGTTWLSNTEPERDHFMVSYSSFLRPKTLYLVDGETLERKAIYEAPRRFDPSPYASRQYFATSKDGTRVPYFLVAKKDLEPTGKHPTLLTGYGGFRAPQRPRYLAQMGRNWLDRGGVYVRACIRGGGEYGPRWHEAARREKRPRAFEDFEAIAEDLIRRKITSPAHLGIRGGSNGGLLVGACFTRRPELFGAVVCQAPLLDMKRYGELLAGPSWKAEYGDPSKPEDWAFLKTYSPYHNLRADKSYPRVLFTTATTDDRVHPGHARKMAALMQAQGHPVLFYENTEGGHSGAANARQRARMTALVFAYLLTELTD